jgi:site-specific DNA-cytosine methylase
LRFLSLFSGIEAASQAWKPLGWECVGVSEIEAFPCNVLSQIHPDVPNLGDITKITELDIFTLGQIDLVVFGSPCQDLSVAGKRKGLDGARSGLFHDAMRVVGWARKHGGCRFALWENVPGAFSSNGGDDFGIVVGQMAGLDCPTPPKGWGTEGATIGTEAMVEWSVLDAQWFGVAQRRRRVFALADFGDWANRPPILLEPRGLRGDTAPTRETGQEISPTIRAGAANGGAGHGARSGDSKDELITVHTATCGGIGDYSSSSRSNAIRASGADLGHGCEVLVSGEPRRPVRVAEPVWPAEVCCTLDTTFGTKQGLENQHVNAGCPMFVPHVAYSEDVLGFNSNAQVDEMRFDPHVSASLTCSQNAAVAYGIPGNWIGRTPENGGNAVEPMHNVAPCLTKTDRHAVAFAENSRGELRYENGDGHRIGTLSTGGGKPGQGAPMVIINPNMQVRRLTPRECERLQGSPTTTPRRLATRWLSL